MTTDEMLALKERIAAAEKALHRVQYLREGIAKLSSDAIDSIEVPVSPSAFLRYYERDNGTTTIGPKTVCWASQETGLAAELNAAFQAVLAHRLAQAEQELAAL